MRQAPSLAVPSDRRSVDPAVLSDMARQLQAALSRPSSAVTPAPTPAAVTTPDGVDPVAAAMASAPPVPVPHERPAPARAPSPPPAAAKPAPAMTPPVTPPDPIVLEATPPAVPAPPASPPMPPAQPAQASQPTQQKAASTFQPAPPPPPAERPDSNSAGNPFSVEEIEAEFARLLGRPLDKRS
ncbi:hypothetical protein ACRAWG_38410 [Methylobacterium sp. P31]